MNGQDILSQAIQSLGRVGQTVSSAIPQTIQSLNQAQQKYQEMVMPIPAIRNTIQDLINSPAVSQYTNTPQQVAQNAITSGIPLLGAIKNYAYNPDTKQVLPSSVFPALADITKTQGDAQKLQKMNTLYGELAMGGVTSPIGNAIKALSPSTGGEIGGIKPKIKINEKQLQDTGWTELNNGNTKAALEDRYVDDITAEKYFDGEMPYTISTIESKVSKTGSATDMVKQIQNYAQEQGKPIIITPDARPSRITETGTKTPLTQTQLESWYEKLGFKKILSGEEKGAMYWKSKVLGEIPKGGVK